MNSIFDREPELWKPVNDDRIKPMYEVSNLGRIRNTKSGKVLKPWTCKSNGYLYVSLMSITGRPIKRTVHSLVMYAFTDEPEKINDPKYIINHKNYDADDEDKCNTRQNNKYSNLEWVTYGDNSRHGIMFGNVLHAQDATTAKIDDDTVHNICKLFEDGVSYEGVIKELGLPHTSYTKSLLIRIRTGKQWKSISSKYNFKKGSRLRHHTEAEVRNVCRLLDEGITSSKDIQAILGSDEDSEVFRKFVYFIKNRQCYKDISDDYYWWR